HTTAQLRRKSGQKVTPFFSTHSFVPISMSSPRSRPFLFFVSLCVFRAQSTMMNRLTLALLLLCASVPLSQVSLAAPGPDIIFILADDTDCNFDEASRTTLN